MKREFKVGDVVKCVSDKLIDKYCKNKTGRIIEIDDSDLDYPYLIEFFEPVLYGHSGSGEGKYEHCWNFDEDEIELHTPILKLFLKEKNSKQQDLNL